MSRPRILVINPNSNVTVTKGLEEALKPLDFVDGPEIVCHDAGRGALRDREPVRCRQRGDAAAPADRERQQRFRLRDRLPTATRVCMSAREGTDRPVFGIAECGRADGDDARGKPSA